MGPVVDNSMEARPGEALGRAVSGEVAVWDLCDDTAVLPELSGMAQSQRGSRHTGGYTVGGNRGVSVGKREEGGLLSVRMQNKVLFDQKI